MSENKTKKTTREIGDELARDMGAQNANEYTDNLKKDINSKNITKAAAAKASALDFTQKLLKLVLYQEIKGEYSLSKYEWINKFDDERIENGDGKEYIKNLLTGVDAYDVDKFIPDKATLPSADATVIRLYQNDGRLAKYAFKALKPLTILESQWFPYFMSGKLMEFIDGQIELMKKSLFLYKYNTLSTLIKDMLGQSEPVKISKRIQGSATNILNCFVNEIFPEIENIQYFNGEFAIDATKNSQYPNVSNRDDLLLIMNRKTLNRFKNSAMSNELNVKLINFNDVLPLDNIIGTGLDLTIGASDDNIKVAATEMIPEEKVLVINKNALKYLWFVDLVDNQKFIQNMSIQYVAHLWGVFGVIGWESAFIYENENLKVLPITTRG